MGFDRSFSAGVALRLGAIGATMFALVGSLSQSLAATAILSALLLVAAVASLWAYVRRTNVEVARFVQALMHGDLSQGFSTGRRGGGFEILGRQLDSAIRTLRDERAAATDAGRFHAALVDEAPVALLVIDEDRVELVNRAARKLFHTDAVRIEDFAGFGDDLVAALHGRGRRLGIVSIDGRPQRASMLATPLHRLGRPLRLLAIQPLHSEIDAVEMSAQADLVRVLTHEIMNSMTPVTSLARSAASLMADAPADLADARMAIETVARRSEGIMHFVEGYRAFIRSPVIHPRRFAAKGWAEEMGRLFAATPEGEGAGLKVSVAPDDLMLDLDPDLMAQAVLNLMKNGAEAAAGAGRSPQIGLTIARGAAGIAITVGDNGRGIPPDLTNDIFLPFFTTKPTGTGVGLSLVRRIVTAHRGTVALRHSGPDGTSIEILV
ncbi:sensor histidine kinase [Sphingomonas crocodyli]|uniref:histidine kinase n=1 Tax=Sphingomonas crocodyli TaxID=1979270 RepID=A0A437M8Y8_9SPHN|nr:ATP-binding protein [Sphingomonas crocodyli]RVT94119.1 PAS domain-containing protein [Sphingomonas crocodyli]